MGKQVSVTAQRQDYIPALSFAALTPFYDTVLRWVMQEERFKRVLLQRAAIRDGQYVLDLGCGTGTLTIQAKRGHPGAIISGLDGDLNVLALAQSKAARAGAPLDLSAGMVTQLPYGKGVYDCVLASLVFHHLDTANKSSTMREVLRVLRPGGKLCIIDFGRPVGLVAYLISLVVRNLEETGDNIKGALPSMLEQTGFTNVQTQTHFLTVAGTLTLYVTEKPAE